jgi:hypothetical protein
MDRRGLGKHIGKVLSLKNEIFRLYTNGENEMLRSVWYHGDIDRITTIYQAGFVEGPGMNFVSVESVEKLGFRQVRLRSTSEYNFVSAGVNVELRQLIQILRFMKCAEYFTRKKILKLKKMTKR